LIRFILNVVQCLMPLTGSALRAEPPIDPPKDAPMRRDWLRLYVLIGLVLIGGGAIIVASSHDPTIHIWEGND
jgi:hypothetical protein